MFVPSFKSKLNEYCQKNRVNPTYSCSCTGPSHLPSFTATVQIKFTGGIIKVFTGNPSQTKKAAEESAASVALVELESTKISLNSIPVARKQNLEIHCKICGAKDAKISCPCCSRKVCSNCYIGCNVCDSEPHCEDCVEYHYYGE